MELFLTDKSFYIDISCDCCGRVNGLSIENSKIDQSIKCGGCGTFIYWHNCPKCGTGFSDSSKELFCQDCDVLDNCQKAESEASYTLFDKACPWCNGPINVIPYLILKKVIGTCPSCSKHYTDSGMIKSLIFYILFMIVTVVILKPYMLLHPSLLFKISVAIFIIIGGLLVFIKSMRLKKYK